MEKINYESAKGTKTRKRKRSITKSLKNENSKRGFQVRNKKLLFLTMPYLARRSPDFLWTKTAALCLFPLKRSAPRVKRSSSEAIIYPLVFSTL